MPVAKLTDIVLSDEQQRAVDTIVGSGKQVQTLGGFAGTGKTTVIAELVRRLPRYAVCAYTGKAADVLRRKGLAAASTIHSLIYRAVEDGDGGVAFELVPELDADGIIVDEASMVGPSIYTDLMSLGVPLVFVGDHGQLEPVGDSGFNLMAAPDVALETIHRNAGPIARFAEHLRLGRDAADWEPGGTDGADAAGVRVVDFDEVGRLDINRDWQLICAYNHTRNSLNEMVRDHIGMPAGVPEAGDRVMCLQNNRVYGLFNGMQGTIADIDRDRRVLTFDSEQGPRVRVPYNPRTFGSSGRPDWSREIVPFDWAYCVTCHKFQGDETDDVCVIEQHCGAWDHRRWSYTAASRVRTGGNHHADITTCTQDRYRPAPPRRRQPTVAGTVRRRAARRHHPVHVGPIPLVSRAVPAQVRLRPGAARQVEQDLRLRQHVARLRGGAGGGCGSHTGTNRTHQASD